MTSGSSTKTFDHTCAKFVRNHLPRGATSRGTRGLPTKNLKPMRNRKLLSSLKGQNLKKYNDPRRDKTKPFENRELSKREKEAKA